MLSSFNPRVGLEECGSPVDRFAANTALITWYVAELFLFSASLSENYVCFPTLHTLNSHGHRNAAGLQSESEYSLNTDLNIKSATI